MLLICSENFKMACVKEQSADLSVDKLCFSLDDMKQIHVQFAEEAFNFLRKNSQIWIEHPKDFLLRHDISNCSGTFTQDVAKSVLTIAYSLHIIYRKRTRVMFHKIKTATDYENYISSYNIPQNESYFYNFLAWISFTFDFTMHCYKAGFDFLQTGRRVLASYSHVTYFHSRGGWGKLLEFASYMAAAFDRISRFVIKDEPLDEVTYAFVRSAEVMERYNKRFSVGSSRPAPQLWYLRHVQRDIFDKISHLMKSPRITTGVKVVMKKSPVQGKSLKEVCPKAAELLEKYGVKPKTDKDVLEISEQLAETTLSVEPQQVSHKHDIAESPQLSLSNDKVPVFIINERFLEKRDNEKDSQQPKNKRGLKIFSPSKQVEVLSMHLSEVLEENIKQKNIDKIGEDIYAVYPPGCDIDDDDTRVIVLDSSSEDENDDDVVVTGRQIEKLVKEIYAKNRSQVGDKSLLAQLQTVTEESIGHTDECVEPLKLAPTKATGAIPKIKVHPQSDELEPAKNLSFTPPPPEELEPPCSKDNDQTQGETPKPKARSRRRRRRTKH